MVRRATLASILSVAAGAWDIYSYSTLCHSACLPGSYSAPNQGAFGPTFILLSAVLVLVGLAGFVGPKRVYYGGAAAALLIDVIELLDYSGLEQTYLYATLALNTVALLVSVLALRARTGVSEQSHPMNLPVFG